MDFLKISVVVAVFCRVLRRSSSRLSQPCLNSVTHSRKWWSRVSKSFLHICMNFCCLPTFFQNIWQQNAFQFYPFCKTHRTSFIQSGVKLILLDNTISHLIFVHKTVGIKYCVYFIRTGVAIGLHFVNFSKNPLFKNWSDKSKNLNTFYLKFAANEKYELIDNKNNLITFYTCIDFLRKAFENGNFWRLQCT